MPAYLNAISGAVPRHAYPQQRILEVMREWHGADRRAGRLLGGIYRASESDCRHSVIDDFQPGARAGFFYGPGTGEVLCPTTGERNELYRREATPLAAQAARRVLDDARAPAAGITRLITVSCTGFFAPGPDIELIHELGLHPGVERYHIGFMGCYAAIPALRLARSLVEAQPGARVLLVSVELCTLHLQAQHDPDSLVAASVFSDGAAAALVIGRREGPRSYRLDRFATALVPGASREMAWTIGDSGFLMTLWSKIPAVIEEHLEGAVGQLLEGEDPGVSLPGRCIRAAAQFSTASRSHCRSRRAVSPPPAMCCASSATCRAPPCCLCSSGSSAPATTRQDRWACSRSVPASRSRARSSPWRSEGAGDAGDDAAGAHGRPALQPAAAAEHLRAVPDRQPPGERLDAPLRPLFAPPGGPAGQPPRHRQRRRRRRPAPRPACRPAGREAAGHRHRPGRAGQPVRPRTVARGPVRGAVRACNRPGAARARGIVRFRRFQPPAAPPARGAAGTVPCGERLPRPPPRPALRPAEASAGVRDIQAGGFALSEGVHPR